MAPPAVTNAVLAERFDNLEKLINELKGAIEKMDKRLSEVEQIEFSCKGISEFRNEVDRKKMEDFKANLSEVDKRVKKLEEGFIDLIQTNKILRWLTGVFTALLVAIVIAIATGEIQVMIR